MSHTLSLVGGRYYKHLLVGGRCRKHCDWLVVDVTHTL